MYAVVQVCLPFFYFPPGFTDEIWAEGYASVDLKAISTAHASGR